jgi:hypothetical protein
MKRPTANGLSQTSVTLEPVALNPKIKNINAGIPKATNMIKAHPENGISRNFSHHTMHGHLAHSLQQSLQPLQSSLQHQFS